MKGAHRKFLKQIRDRFPAMRFDLVQGGKHLCLKVIAEDARSRKVFVASSPSDHRSYANTICDVKRAIHDLENNAA